MEEQVQEAIKKIEENWIEILRKCSGLKERLDKLMEILPETRWWSPPRARQLVYYLHQKYGLDFGVCHFYEMEDDRQYCTANGERVECLCAIPEAHCVCRDKDGKPKYPEFHFIRVLESL